MLILEELPWSAQHSVLKVQVREVDCAAPFRMPVVEEQLPFVLVSQLILIGSGVNEPPTRCPIFSNPVLHGDEQANVLAYACL